MNTPAIDVSLAAPEDAGVIADLIRRAFEAQALLYEDDSLPPLSETDESVATSMREGIVLVARDAAGRIVGSVRGTERDATCYVERLVVEPDLHNSGIGRALAEAIESHFPGVASFEILTGHRSEPALHLYGSLGYKRYKMVRVHEHLNLVYLRKAAGERT